MKLSYAGFLVKFDLDRLFMVAKQAGEGGRKRFAFLWSLGFSRGLLALALQSSVPAVRQHRWLSHHGSINRADRGTPAIVNKANIRA